MRLLTLEDYPGGESYCHHHNLERTVTLLNPRTECSLQVHATQEDQDAVSGTFLGRTPNKTQSQRLQLPDTTDSHIVEAASNPVGYTVHATSPSQPVKPTKLQIDRELIRHHLVNLRSIIPHHEALDEEEHIHTVKPLPSQWHFPPNAHYCEARRGYMAYPSAPLIAELVTCGIMLANEVGIRWKHLDQYVLLATEPEEQVFNQDNPPRLERLDPEAYRRKRISRLDVDCESNGALGESPRTPIIELESSCLSLREKRVRLCSKKACKFVSEKVTVSRLEDLEDNEGKTAEWQRAREVEKRKKPRSKMYWDSERRY